MPRNPLASGLLLVAVAVAPASTGYQFLQTRRIQDALAIFRLNATDHPDDATSQYQLGETFRFTGQLDQSAVQYEKTLRLDPKHPLAGERLKAVKGF